MKNSTIKSCKAIFLFLLRDFYHCGQLRFWLPIRWQMHQTEYSVEIANLYADQAAMTVWPKLREVV